MDSASIDTSDKAVTGYVGQRVVVSRLALRMAHYGEYKLEQDQKQAELALDREIAGRLRDGRSLVVQYLKWHDVDSYRASECITYEVGAIITLALPEEAQVGDAVHAGAIHVLDGLYKTRDGRCFERTTLGHWRRTK